MKDPRPQDYDPTYKHSVTVEEFDVSDLTPITPKSPPAKPQPAPPRPAPKKKIARVKHSTAKGKSSPYPTVRPERPERVAPAPSPKKAVPSPTPAELAEKREIKRHSFEFYRDQLPHLKRLKAEFMIRGADKSMSAMVREAVDAYIEAHTS